MAAYDTAFFDYVNSGAIQSAEYVLPLLKAELAIASVLDVGCGQGAWLSVWRKSGVPVTVGIDGDYVKREHLLIPPDSFMPLNLVTEFDLGMHFDLVQSLEVAEHLPAKSASSFVRSLIKHSDLVLFSAAPKGQGGDHHINEQSYDYWRAHFAENGYIAIDYLRPIILHDKRIEPWYRYNMILFATASRFETLPDSIRCRRIPDNKKIPDISPLPYKVRKALVRLLPVAMKTRVAKIKERIVINTRNRPPAS